MDVVFSNLTIFVFILAVTYTCGLAFVRIFFHPLSHFDGPRLAAVTSWYEFYQDVVLGGQYLKSYHNLHEQHGPVIRISPNALHVNDISFFNEVYRKGSKFLKDPRFYQSFGVTESLLMFTDPSKHRIRHGFLKSLFSRQYMDEFAPVIERITSNAIARVSGANEGKYPLDVQQMFRCITVDTIMSLLFGSTLNLTVSKEQNPPFLMSMDLFSDRVMLSKHFPILNRIALNLPRSWAETVAPGYVGFRDQCVEWIQEVHARHQSGVYETEDGRPTMFDLLLHPREDKGLQVPDMESLIDEAFIFCFAGTDTTSYALTCATYYVLSHPDVAAKLSNELDTVARNANGILEYRHVCNLPYLTAVIKETLRFSSPIPGNLPRVVPREGITIKGQFIPPGVTVSMSARMIHFDPEIFTDPERFLPDRWLGAQGKELENWNVAFSKGSRACIGVNLAYLELYVCLANLFAQATMRLYETDETSMDWRDCGTAKNARHVKVIVEQVGNSNRS